MKPVIGIVAKPSRKTDMWSYMEIVDNIRYVLVKNGALAVGLLPTEAKLDFKDDEELDKYDLTSDEKRDLEAVISRLDGVVLQGGLVSNQYEEEIVKICIEKDVPVIGICSGFNNVVRALGDGITVKADKLDLYGQFVGKFDENSEYYDIYAVDADGNRVEIASDSLIKISANVKELKNFIGVYEIVQGDKLKLISYEKNGGKVEWTTHALGKFVMAYGETKPKDEDLYAEPDKNGANGNGIDWALVVSVSAIGVVALGVVAFVTRKALNNTKIR